jgi:hypothetical protein
MPETNVSLAELESDACRRVCDETAMLLLLATADREVAAGQVVDHGAAMTDLRRGIPGELDAAQS